MQAHAEAALPEIEILDTNTYVDDHEYGCTTIAQIGDRKVRVRIRRNATQSNAYTHACLDVLTSGNKWEYTTGIGRRKLEQALPSHATGRTSDPYEFADKVLEGPVTNLLDRAQMIFK